MYIENLKKKKKRKKENGGMCEGYNMPPPLSGMLDTVLKVVTWIPLL